MSFSVENFISTIQRSDLARQNRFIVEIGDSEFVSLLATSTTFPLLSINVKPYKVFGPSYQRPISSEYGGDGITVSFLVDRDMIVKKYFDTWTQSVVAPTGGVNYQAEYIKPVVIKQLNAQDQVVYSVKLIDAFPRNLNLMSLNQAAQNQVHTLDVLFAYRYWISLETQVPKASFVPQLEIPPIVATETSRVLTSLGQEPSNVDFSDSTFSVPSA